MGESFEHDVFLSYSHADRDLVYRKIIRALAREGLNVWWDGRFPPGSDPTDQIEAAIRLSRKTLVVMTRPYLRSGWTQFEQCLCQTLEHNTRTVRMLLLKCGSVSVPNRYTTRVYESIPNIQKLDKRWISSIVKAIRPEPLSVFQFTKGGSVLAIGLHWDDILLGCLGTLIRLKKVFAFNVDVLVLCNSYTHYYYRVTQDDLTSKALSMYASLCKACGFTNLGAKIPEWLPEVNFTDKELHKIRDQIAKIMEKVIEHNDQNAMPYNLVLSPPIDDTNKDHATTGEIVFSQFRGPGHSILEYEIKRYTDRLFAPNLCVSLDPRPSNTPKKARGIAEEKVHHIQNTCGISNA